MFRRSVVLRHFDRLVGVAPVLLAEPGIRLPVALAGLFAERASEIPVVGARGTLEVGGENHRKLVGRVGRTLALNDEDIVRVVNPSQELGAGVDRLGPGEVDPRAISRFELQRR